MQISSPATTKRTGLSLPWILAFGLLARAVTPAWAAELPVTPENPPRLTANATTDEPAWAESPFTADHSPVRVLIAGQRMDAGCECYVITPGMGGTVSGDSFHQLAATICKRIPQACVIRLDWSEKASVKFLGIFNPWEVARSIDAVGDQAAAVLKKEGLDPAHTTFIGESYGNWVNARIAHQLGGVHGILALNPAHEGGYTLPDLRKHAQRSWSFHTYSVFDTTQEIADCDFWLETPKDATHWGQHVAGIKWLAARIEAGDHSWLSLDKTLPQRRAGCFRAKATIEGQLLDEQLPRERPLPVETIDRPSTPSATDVTVVAE